MNEEPVGINLFKVPKKDGLHYLNFLEINVHTINVVIISAHIVSKPDEKYTQ